MMKRKLLVFLIIPLAALAFMFTFNPQPDPPGLTYTSFNPQPDPPGFI
ncbi:hypothetical protein ACFOLF_19900 [Paenibacillus sepulcri]|uniref:Uncharacterized protein n=1 Tax=Paenibacillus sepulcri TaxID=359917 RepID=A0ABS7C0Q7_9BACL|nr:hypothetical protein [Paenibacillus sepulcri]